MNPLLINKIISPIRHILIIYIIPYIFLRLVSYMVMMHNKKRTHYLGSAFPVSFLSTLLYKLKQKLGFLSLHTLFNYYFLGVSCSSRIYSSNKYTDTGTPRSVGAFLCLLSSVSSRGSSTIAINFLAQSINRAIVSFL